jgi:hypothetical protein
VSARESELATTASVRCVAPRCGKSSSTAQPTESCFVGSRLNTYLARRQLRWLGHVWRMGWPRLPAKEVEEKRVTRLGGRELTWGEGVEEVLKRASHAFPSAGNGPRAYYSLSLVSLSLCRGAALCLGSSGRGARERLAQWCCGRSNATASAILCAYC